MGKYFYFYSCCVPIFGANRSIICDLQRDKYYFIPNALFYILSKELSEKNKIFLNIKEIINKYSVSHKDIITEYFDYLDSEELGFYSDEINENIKPINFNKVFIPRPITNIIIDIEKNTSYVKILSYQVQNLNCESAEIRLFSHFDLKNIGEIINLLQGSSIRSIYLFVPYSEDLTTKKLLKLHYNFPRLKRIVVFSSDQYNTYDEFEFELIFTTEKVGYKSCGVINDSYFISGTNSFSEALKHNSCLHKKIAIDKEGNIKNCPSMVQSFGNITETTLQKALEDPDFKKYWNISKDKIEVCKDCEFRYICTDCRAYTERTHFDENTDLSKPLKCGYDPYTNQWTDWSTNLLKQKAIKHYDFTKENFI